MSEREYDITLFGATGFVGRLTAEHLATYAPDGIRIALAGRSQDKLQQVRSQLPSAASEWPLVIADSADEASLDSMAANTRLVITTVGPYARYGLPLVGACARAGTDYVDLTGEVLFVRESIDSYQQVAQESGARIVHACGFDSVPSDLGVLLLAEAAGADGADGLGDTTLYMSMKGGVSGGTVASMATQIDAIRGDSDKRKVVTDKFALSPDRSAEPSGEHSDAMGVHFAQEIEAWTAPFVMASYNTRIVRRSNALGDHGYGPQFRYRELQRTGTGIAGRLTAVAVAGGLAAALGAFALKPLRPVLDKLLPAAGEGPSEESRAAGRFRADLRSTTPSGATYRAEVSATGDPGYAATAVMLGESALSLVVSRDECPLPAGMSGGILTPATALGNVLAQRLRARGFTLTASRA